MYADDTSLSYQSSDVTQLREAINNDLKETWQQGNKLALNVEKTIPCFFLLNKNIEILQESYFQGGGFLSVAVCQRRGNIAFAMRESAQGVQNVTTMRHPQFLYAIWLTNFSFAILSSWSDERRWHTKVLLRATFIQTLKGL